MGKGYIKLEFIDVSTAATELSAEQKQKFDQMIEQDMGSTALHVQTQLEDLSLEDRMSLMAVFMNSMEWDAMDDLAFQVFMGESTHMKSEEKSVIVAEDTQ